MLILEEIGDAELHLVFRDHCSTFIRHIRRIIGEEILEPEAKRVIYPSQFLFVFISNILDLLQDVRLVEMIINKVVNTNFFPSGVFSKSCQRYDLWKGKCYVGGMFPRNSY